MKWTQAKINAWALTAFGKATPQHMIARAIQECSELLMEITKAEPSKEKIAEECADIIGPLCRIAEYAECDITPAFELSYLIAPNQLYGPCVMLMTNLVFLMERLGPSNVIQKNQVATLVVRIVIYASEICSGVGAKLRDEIDKKMEVLLSRQWELDGNGAGQHIKEPASFVSPNDIRQMERCQLGGTCKPGHCARRPECWVDV